MKQSFTGVTTAGRVVCVEAATEKAEDVRAANKMKPLVQ